VLHEPLWRRAVGRWQSILPSLGVPLRALRNRHGPCPICGGKDRFRFDDKGGRGTWICSKCGAGDGIEFVKRFLHVDFKQAARLIEQHIGSALTIATRDRQPQTDGQKRDEIIGLRKRSLPITRDDYAGQYLNARTGLTAFPENLRFAPDERYSEPGKRASWHPIMVAKVDPSDSAAAQGERAALHRTYLSPYGTKADVASPRKMMGTMPSGAAVRLMPHQELLGIAEGIETALSASILFNVPVWAALNAGLLQVWTPPTTVTTVFVFGDNDVSSTGQAAAYTLAQRLKAKGLSVFVEIPCKTGQDWNDVLMAKLLTDERCLSSTIRHETGTSLPNNQDTFVKAPAPTKDPLP
jgi:putative DNA primase/helicase